MQSIAEELEKKTKLYWILSSNFQGRIQGNMTTQAAIKMVVNGLANLNPERPLYNAYKAIKKEIIQGTSNIKESPASILPLPIIREPVTKRISVSA